MVTCVSSFEEPQKQDTGVNCKVLLLYGELHTSYLAVKINVLFCMLLLLYCLLMSFYCNTCVKNAYNLHLCVHTCYSSTKCMNCLMQCSLWYFCSWYSTNNQIIIVKTHRLISPHSVNSQHSVNSSLTGRKVMKMEVRIKLLFHVYIFTKYN